MVRIHHRGARASAWIVVAFALVAGLGACKKDEKKADPANPASAEKSDQPAADLASGKANANADDLSLLPVDAEIVLGLNFQQLQTSVLWKKFAEPKLMSGDVQKKLTEFKDKCGFDPLTAVKSMSIGLKNIGGTAKPDGAIVVHGPEKAKVMTCLEKEKGTVAKDGTKVEVDGDVVVITQQDGEAFAFTFVNDTTVLGVLGANANVAGVKAAAAGGSALKTSPAFVEMYAKIKTQDSLWMLMNGASKAFDKAAQMGFKPKAVFGSINVTDGLTVDMRMRLETPDQAAQISGMAKGQAAQAQAMFDKLEIVNDGADVKVAIVLSAKKLEALVAQFGGLLGGMGGP